MPKLIATRLQNKLIIAFVLVLAVPSVFVGIVNFTSTYNELVSRSLDSALSRNHELSQAIANSLSRAKPDSIYLSLSPAVQAYASAVVFGTAGGIEPTLLNVGQAFTAYLQNLPEYDSIALLDKQGNELVRVRSLGGAPAVLVQNSLQNRSRTDYFRQGVTLPDGRVYASTVSLNIEDNQIEQPLLPVIHFVTPVRATNGDVAGVVVLNMLADTFLNQVKGDNPNEKVYLIDATDGSYLAGDQSKDFARDFQDYHVPIRLPFPIPKGNFLPDHPQEGPTLLTSTSGANFGSPDEPNLQQVYSRVIVSDLPAIQWLLYRTEPTSEILGNIYGQIGATALLLLVALLVAIGAALVFTRNIVHPVQELASVAGSISQGNWNAPLPKVTNRDEIGDLAKAFSTMSSELKKIYDTLDERVQQRTAELETVLRVSATTTSILDLSQLLRVFVNLTKERFNLYGAQIFLLDQTAENLVMAAEAGETVLVGNTLNGHVSVKSAQSLAARAVRSGQAVIENDVTASPDFAPDPRLPKVRSALALLMTSGQRTIGVLAVQSDQPNHFAAQDVKVLTSLAEQVAIAVRNAQLFAQAQEAQAAAEQANQIKSLFLANVSHELRTPLNAIINFTLFLLREMVGPVSDEQKELLQKVYDSGKHLLGLINDVLDISKIESGSLELYVEDGVGLEEEIQMAVTNSKALLEDRPVAVVTDIDKSLPAIRGDRQRILQIILNVLSNACKFTEKGEIRISAARQDGEILLAIKDTGPGISEEEQKAIFKTFKQGEAGLRRGGGTGLGMSISKRLAEAHGGRMWLESRKGEGATFYVALPVLNEKLKVAE